MNQIAVITDTHFGARNDSRAVLDNQEKFYDEIFFPVLKERNIKYVLDLGDTFDKRKSIDFNTLDRAKRFYFDRLKAEGIQVIAIVGNHTAYYEDTNSLHTLDHVLSDYDNVQVIHDIPKEIEIYGKSFLFLPWINVSNRDRAMEIVAESRADILCSHLQLKGFVMHRGSVCVNGMDAKDFSHFDRVWSGHFHSPSSENNVHYLGSPTETTWADYGDVKGFHVYTPETDKLEMIINPFGLHRRIRYNDGMTILDVPDVEGQFVIVDVETKDDVEAFRDFMDAIYAKQPADVKTHEISKIGVLSDSSLEAIDIENVEDTSKAIVRYIEEKVERNPEKVKAKLLKYYKEAIN